MENYELSRLNPLSFERLVRALAFAELGPGGTVFSVGPDGGRDFTCHGNIKGYESQKWSGYLVIQAKFRQQLKGDETDLDWLKKELEKELEKYIGDQNLRKPDYYIVATNVALSGADGKGAKGSYRTGGDTKLHTYMKSWVKKVGLVGYDFWPHDKIVDLLASHPGVRQTYAAWVTPGDVLSAILTQLQPQLTSFSSVIRRALKTSLRRDQFAKLKDAGSVAESQVRTSQVFVDLPIGEYKGEGVVQLLAERAREVHSADHSPSESEAISPSGRNRNRIVLLGGPGQGKSTATLFLAQLFRAKVLQRDISFRNDENIKHLVPEIISRAQFEGVTGHSPIRYPVHVALPRFADAISTAKKRTAEPPTLLAYLASELGKCADEIVSRNDLRLWLGNYPWIIVLDGLDEVPPSGERESVIDGINGLLSEVADSDADCLLVVTTRPQGYNDDLDRDSWEHWSLADLPPDRALAYADALASAQYPVDQDRRDEIAKILKEATGKPATSRLMKSPLQVTIMHLIVDTGGSIPAARWTLFNEYFEVLKKREKSKGGETQRAIEKNLTHLGPIHQRAGLILQVMSEQAGGANAFLDVRRFNLLLSRYLKSAGYKGDELSARVAELMHLALNRLVLLSAHEEGKISFDVRSLQEYMAAAALTSGNQDAMELRLLHIAGKAHWQHVLLIASSRCFAEDAFHHRRSAAVSIARQLETSKRDFIVKNGAKLALEMFTDGIGTDHPISRRQLCSHALELLELGWKNLDERLNDIVEPDTQDLVFDVLTNKILEVGAQASLAAWHLITCLSARGDPLATAVIVKNWLAAAPEFLSGLDPASATTIAARYPSQMAIAAGNCSPQRLAHLLLGNSKEVLTLPKELKFLEVLKQNRRSAGILHNKKDDLLVAHFLPIPPPQSWDMPPDNALPHGEWRIISRISRFSTLSTRADLVTILRDISQSNLLEQAKNVCSLAPWIFGSLVGLAETNVELDELAGRVALGEFGDASDWARAEQRWEDAGLTAADISQCKDGRWFGRDIAERGMFMPTALTLHHSPRTWDVAYPLIKLINKVRKNRISQDLSALAHFSLINPMGERTAEEALEIAHFLSSIEGDRIHLEAFGHFGPIALNDSTILSLLNYAATNARIWPKREANFINADAYASAYAKDDSKRGLLIIITASLLSSKEHNAIDKILYKLPTSAYKHSNNDNPKVRSCISILRLLSSNASASEVVKILLSEGGTHSGISMVHLLAELPFIPVELKEELIASLIQEGRGVIPEVSEFHPNLQKCLDGRLSRFLERSFWMDEAALPEDAFEVLSQPG